jgi:adenosylcobinamide-phosphate synthase
MFGFAPQPSGAGIEPMVLLLFALLIESYIGEAAFVFRRIKHPVAVLGDHIGWLDSKLNRERRTPLARLIRGTLVVLWVTALSAVAGAAIAWLSANHLWGWAVELVLLVALLAGRGLYDAVNRVGTALAEVSTEAGRREVSHIVGRDPAALDAHGVARAAIESLAENFGDAVVGPVFWYLLFGFPGLCVFKAVNTMDSMLGHRTPRHEHFGMAAARLDDALCYIPARLSALYLAAAAMFVPKANPANAVRAMFRDAGKHRSVNAGWPEAAAAGGLGLSLAGPRRYANRVVNDAWIGDGRSRATPGDIGRALYLYGVACLLNAAVVGVVALSRF